MTDRVLLTEQREQFIEGEYPDGISQRTLKHRLRGSVSTVFDKLTQIAQSDELDNEDVFDPIAVVQLAEAVLGPLDEIKPRYEVYNHDDPDRDRSALTEHRAEYEYQEELALTLKQLSDRYARRFDILPPQEDSRMQTEDGGPVRYDRK